MDGLTVDWALKVGANVLIYLVAWSAVTWFLLLGRWALMREIWRDSSVFVVVWLVLGIVVGFLAPFGSLSYSGQVATYCQSIGKLRFDRQTDFEGKVLVIADDVWLRPALVESLLARLRLREVRIAHKQSLRESVFPNSGGYVSYRLTDPTSDDQCPSPWERIGTRGLCEFDGELKPEEIHFAVSNDRHRLWWPPFLAIERTRLAEVPRGLLIAELGTFEYYETQPWSGNSTLLQCPEDRLTLLGQLIQIRNET